MGFGKAFKKAVKQVTGGVKTFVKNPTSKEGLEAGAGMAIAGLSGGTLGGALAGASLTADAGRRTQKKAASEERAEQHQAELEQQNIQTYGFKNAVELAQARKKKQEELAGREETRATGIGSLIGRGKTLG